MSQSNKKDFFVNVITAAMIVAGIERGRGGDWVAQVVAECMFVPADALPDNLVEVGHMALEFIEWQCGPESEPQPEWYKNEWAAEW